MNIDSLKDNNEINNLLTEDGINENKLSKEEIVKLIEISPKGIDYYLEPDESGNIPVKQFEIYNGYIVELIKQTKSIDKYLEPDENGKILAKQLGLNIDCIVELIEQTKNIDKYLEPDENGKIPVKDFFLLRSSAIEELIKQTKNVDKYLEPDENGKIPVKQLGLDKYDIIELIKDSPNIDKYLEPDENEKIPVKQLELDKDDIIDIMRNLKNGAKKYIIPNDKGIIQAKKLGLEKNDIFYLLLKSEPNDLDILFDKDKNGYQKISDYDFDDDQIVQLLPKTRKPVQNYIKQFNIKDPLQLKILEELNNINPNICGTLQPAFLKSIKNEFSKEILTRIALYPEIQENLIHGTNLDKKAVEYLINNSNNFVLSFDKFNKMLNDQLRMKTKDLYDLLEKEKIGQIDDKLIKNYILAVENSSIFVEIKNINDLKNYEKNQKEKCLEIMKSKDKLDENIEKDFSYNIEKELSYYYGPFSEYDYKINILKNAFLIYCYGINYEDATKLVERYGSKIENMPDTEEMKYLKIMKSIIKCDPKIADEIISNVARNGKLPKPISFENSLNIEGKIIEQYQNIFNKELTDINDETVDKEKFNESYIDENGNKYNIPSYKLNDDFVINVRVEGAYGGETNYENYKEHYEHQNINEFHGNCESIISNDSISIARPKENSVIVGYKEIKGSLLGVAPTDIGSSISNGRFNSYEMNSDYMNPRDIIDNTRHAHNELVEDKIYMSDDGKVKLRKPDYAIWIEEDLISERENTDGSVKEEFIKKRESDEKYIETKKLAVQLEIPIIIIDREKMAIREMTKIGAIQKLLNNESLNEKEKEFGEEYKAMSKPELVKEIITKFENNAIGIRWNEKLNKLYFTNEDREENVNKLIEAIEKMPKEVQKKSKEALYNSLDKEITKADVNNDEIETYEKIQEKLKKDNEITEYEINLEKKKKNKSARLLESYLGIGVDFDDLKKAEQKVQKELNNKEISKNEKIRE